MRRDVVLCKWMGWSYPELLNAPADLVGVIEEMIVEEQEAIKDANRGRG